MAPNNTKYPIGILLPIKNGPNSGYFDQSFDTFSAYKTNIINLLKTKPVERRMQPTFYCRLWDLVFEPNDSIMEEKVTRIITEDISRWVPGVNVDSVIVKYYDDTNKSVDLRDIYKLYIVVNFTVNNTNQSDSVGLILDLNNS